MGFSSAYTSKVADDFGRFHYSKEEDSVWRDLIQRQAKILDNRATPEFLAGIEKLELPTERVPQVLEVNDRLESLTGFGVEAVPAMISEADFFKLLARRKFPVATFVRLREQLDYLQEPDIFHEVYGHCPLLTVPEYADAIETFGRVALELGPNYFTPIYRIFWYTVEFGLVNTRNGLRIYGAGIASSAEESVTCLDPSKTEWIPFDPITAVSQDYRIDVLQPRYYTIPNLEYLYELANSLRSELPKWVKSNLTHAA